MTADEQRLIALILTDDAERERRLRNGDRVAGIDDAAIRRFAASLTRKRRHAALQARRANVTDRAWRLLVGMADRFR